MAWPKASKSMGKMRPLPSGSRESNTYKKKGRGSRGLVQPQGG